MNYPLSQKYNIPLYTDRIMGPNPIKLEEELLRSHSTPGGPGSGQRPGGHLRVPGEGVRFPGDCRGPLE